MKAMLGCMLAVALAQQARAHAEEAPPNMEKYYVVFLRRPPNAPQLDEAAKQALQKQHLAHLRAMYEAGKLVVAGPFDEQKDETMRGMCLYRVASSEEARRLAEGDPAVKAGRLAVDVLAWWVEKGAVSFRPPPPPAGK